MNDPAEPGTDFIRTAHYSHAQSCLDQQPANTEHYYSNYRTAEGKWLVVAEAGTKGTVDLSANSKEYADKQN